MAKYRFVREDTGTECCFEMSQAEFADTCPDGVMTKRSRLDPREKITYRFLRLEKLRLPDGVMAFGCTGTWPQHSDAMGVNPEQVKEAMEAAAAMGVPTEFDPRSGCAIFTDRNHRKRYCEAMGVRDRNGGYSDPQSMRDDERARRYPEAMAFLENEQPVAVEDLLDF